MSPQILILALLLAAATAFAVGGSSADSPGAGDPPSPAPGEPAQAPFYRYDALFREYGEIEGVPWQWLKAFAMNESELGENPLVKAGQLSSDGKSKGLMQLTLPTANDYESVTLDDLNDPETSVRIAARFISDLMGQFAIVDLRYLEWVVKSYNQGAGNTRKERAGTIAGYAEPYWERWQRNLARVETSQGKVA